MTRETNIRDRMVQLAQRLLEQTLEGRASWAPTDQEDSYLFSGSRSSVKIDHYEDREDGDTYTMSLLNQRGTLVEELKTEWHNEFNGFENRVEPATWNEILEHLYDAARREALAIDELLDSVLVDLSDDAPPRPPRGKAEDDPWARAIPKKHPPKLQTSHADDPWANPPLPSRPEQKNPFDDEPPF